ncbi:polysaccharide biosynthesis tyrosine autokinase [Nocardioides sp. GY 10113]|uniref:polysaccharide biosynthesis tyrosine autokinase n=1 Tax=Nocardioides sp. GY 10113 TaxID=2569761 RepID=UPI001458F18C|nr:polysaccharide biosynthesis tyrosine autokinase [Nocardioides sp. GY 10113]
MELRDYLQILRKRWLSILLVTLLVAGAAAGVTALQTPIYSSTARLFVSTAETDDSALFQGGQYSAQRVKSYADLVTSRELANRVIDDLGLDVEAADLSQEVSSAVVLDTVNLTLTVTNTDPSDAQRIAQSYAEQLTDLVRELETPLGERVPPIKATIVDAASFSGLPVSPSWPRNIGLGVVVGFLLGVGIAVLRETLDTRVRTASDVTDVIDAPILGSIGFDPDADKAPLLTDIGTHSARSEAFRVLRTNLQFVDVDGANKVFVVTSSVPEEGKTTTAVNLAMSIAQGGAKVLLIECDLRRPRAIVRLGLDDAVGVTSLLIGHALPNDPVQLHGPSGLHVLAAGPIPPNPAELLQSKSMADLIALARESYDVVLMDAPPLLPVTDAALLAAKADGALLVVGHGRLTRDQLSHSVERLAQVEGQLVGVVLNKMPARSKAYGYGYGYAPDSVDGKRDRP